MMPIPSVEQPQPSPNKRKRWGRWGVMVLIGGVLCCVGLVVFALGLRHYTATHYNDDQYAPEDVPEGYRVAIIFGARVLSNGRLSTMLYDRVKTGVELYHSGKVDVLLMSGDGQSPNYNEPAAMKAYAVARGVPPEAIVLDTAGLRTYDSCVRAHEVYGIERAVLVTQAFHLDRALFLCDAIGIEAVGAIADYQRPQGYSERSMRWQNWREVGATVVAFIDVLTDRPPTIADDARPITLP